MFKPQNKLEKSLIEASKSPAHRPQFYKDFAEAQIFIVEYGPPPERSGKITLQEERNLRVKNIEIEGKLYLPIFSSLPRLQAFISSDAGYLGMKALDFLQMTKGADLILNPGSEYGKEFLHSEVESILDGSIWKPSERFVAQKETQVMIGQPKNYPSELVAELTKLFMKDKNIERAYVAHFYNPDQDDPPHTLVGIVAKNNWEQVVAQAGIVAHDVKIPDPPVDFIQIKGAGGIMDYFKENEPFYRRKKFGIF